MYSWGVDLSELGLLVLRVGNYWHQLHIADRNSGKILNSSISGLSVALNRAYTIIWIMNSKVWPVIEKTRLYLSI